MLTESMKELLKKREFLSVGTCDFKGMPNAVPKFLLKVEDDRIYLVDYTIGTTWRNIKINPRVSLSFINPRTLKSYRINGTVRVITKGAKFDKLFREMQKRAVSLTAQHIIEDLRGQAKYDDYEVGITDKFVIFEVKITDITEIGIKGELKKELLA